MFKTVNIKEQKQNNFDYNKPITGHARHDEWLVYLTGIEPATFRLWGKRRICLHKWGYSCYKQQIFLGINRIVLKGENDRVMNFYSTEEMKECYDNNVL